MAKEPYSYGKRGLSKLDYLRYSSMSKEPHSYGKRDLLHTNETYRYTGRPEVCMNIKRGILIWQKSPVHMAKEPYSYGKRDTYR
jgi:hypothetical protein